MAITRHLYRSLITIMLIAVFISFCAGGATAQSSTSKLYDASFQAETNGDYASALNRVLEIIRSDTKNYTATLRAGWLFYMNKQYKSSIKYYKKAGRLQPKAIEPLLGMSLPLMALKEWKSAEIITKKIIKKDPCNYLAVSRLALVLYYEGKYGEAKSNYLKLLQLYPGDIEMKLGLAWTYVKMGQKSRASTLFNRVLTVRKSNLSALAGIDAVRKM